MEKKERIQCELLRNPKLQMLQIQRNGNHQKWGKFYQRKIEPPQVELTRQAGKFRKK